MSRTHVAAPDDRLAFYGRIVEAWIADRDASVLVVGAEANDRDILESRGYRNVTLLNLGHWTGPLPSDWRYVPGDGTRLPFPDATFDVVLAHATLHHCRAPHAMLLEMYRTAKHTVVFIEARDSWMMRLVTALGITQDYETTAVYYNGGERGGVDDTAVPNFVYRWTEREVVKTIQSYAPHQDHEFTFRHGLALPLTPAARRNASVFAAVVAALRPVARVLGFILRRQQNLFAVRIGKPASGERLKPWLRVTSGTALAFDDAWARQRFRTAPPA